MRTKKFREVPPVPRDKLNKIERIRDAKIPKVLLSFLKVYGRILPIQVKVKRKFVIAEPPVLLRKIGF